MDDRVKLALAAVEVVCRKHGEQFTTDQSMEFANALSNAAEHMLFNAQSRYDQERESERLAEIQHGEEMRDVYGL